MTNCCWILWLKVSFLGTSFSFWVKWSHAFFPPQSVLWFSSSLLVFSHINIDAKIVIFFLNRRECLRGNDIQNQVDALGHFCTQSASLSSANSSCCAMKNCTPVSTVHEWQLHHTLQQNRNMYSHCYQQAWSSHKVTSVPINFSV